MTDHLPECPMLDERYPKHPLEKCDYCEMLRACEQRVLDAAREAVDRFFDFVFESRAIYAILAVLALWALLVAFAMIAFHLLSELL